MRKSLNTLRRTVQIKKYANDWIPRKQNVGGSQVGRLNEARGFNYVPAPVMICFH